MQKNNFENEFLDTILFDALILNRDRHLGNFGVLKENKTGNYTSFAPLFDNGESLFSKADISAFKDEKTFNSYASSKAVNISEFGVDHIELVKAFCNSNQIKKLRKIVDFKFTKHKKYNLPPKRLELINNFVNKRACELIEVIEKGEK